MALTMADAEADNLGLPRPDNHDPRTDLGFGTACGDVVIPGEVCSGPCREAFAAGAPYVATDDGLWCLSCAVTVHGGTARGDEHRLGEACSGCGSRFTTGQEYRATDGGFLCLPCAMGGDTGGRQ